MTTGDDIGSVTRRGRSFKRAPCEGEEGPGGVREGRRRRRFASGTGVRGEVIEQGRSSPCADAYVCVCCEWRRWEGDEGEVGIVREWGDR